MDFLHDVSSILDVLTSAFSTPERKTKPSKVFLLWIMIRMSFQEWEGPCCSYSFWVSVSTVSNKRWHLSIDSSPTHPYPSDAPFPYKKLGAQVFTDPWYHVHSNCTLNISGSDRLHHSQSWDSVNITGIVTWNVPFHPLTDRMSPNQPYPLVFWLVCSLPWKHLCRHRGQPTLGMWNGFFADQTSYWD